MHQVRVAQSIADRLADCGKLDREMGEDRCRDLARARLTRQAIHVLGSMSCATARDILARALWS